MRGQAPIRRSIAVGRKGVGMVQVDPVEFGKRVAAGQPFGSFNYRSYHDMSFECSCGEHHNFKPWMEIIRELPLFRFVIACPKGKHLTLLRARWNRDESARSLTSEIGTELGERRPPLSGIEFQAGLLEAKTGRSWSLEETERFMDLHFTVAKMRRVGREG